MKRVIFGLLTLALLGVASLSALAVTGTWEPVPTKDNVSYRAQDLLEGMSLHEKVCQMMIVYPYRMPNVGGSGYLNATETGSRLQASLAAYPVGGILYDASSMKDHDQLKNLVHTAQSYSETPLLVTIDEEGGRVARIGNTLGYHLGNVTKFDAMQTYASQGTGVAHDNAQTIAENIAWHGFNLDFAPVADTNSNPNNTVIGTRAYSTNFDEASTLVPAAVTGFHDGGVGCTLKHFPGHGDTSGDTHAGSVYLNKSVNELRANELKPFQAGIDAGADAVMLAHIIVSEVGEPTLFSHYLVTEVLREEMGFEGVVITDGLGMKAMTDVYSSAEIAVRATKAGVDLFCCPADMPAAVRALEEAVESGEIPEERIDESVLRILTLKLERGIIQ